MWSGTGGPEGRQLPPGPGVARAAPLGRVRVDGGSLLSLGDEGGGCLLSIEGKWVSRSLGVGGYDPFRVFSEVGVDFSSLMGGFGAEEGTSA